MTLTKLYLLVFVIMQFVCPMCSLSFHTRGDFVEHAQQCTTLRDSHQDWDMFPCPNFGCGCPRKFSTKSNASRHGLNWCNYAPISHNEASMATSANTAAHDFSNLSSRSPPLSPVDATSSSQGIDDSADSNRTNAQYSTTLSSGSHPLSSDGAASPSSSQDDEGVQDSAILFSGSHPLSSDGAASPSSSQEIDDSADLQGNTDLLKKQIKAYYVELKDTTCPTATQVDEVDFLNLVNDLNLSDGVASDILNWVRNCHGDPREVRHTKAIYRDALKIAPESDFKTHSWTQSYNGQTHHYEMEYRSLSGIILDLLESCEDPESTFKFHYEYSDTFSNSNTGDRWRRTELEILGESPKYNESIMGIEIFDDESFQFTRGFLNVAVVIVSLANFTTAYHETNDAKRVLFYKPKYQLSSSELKTDRGKLYKIEFDYNCFSGVQNELETFRESNGLHIHFYGHIRHFFVYLHMLPCDNKQGNIECSVYGSWNCNRACRLCDKLTSEFGVYPYIGNPRTVTAVRGIYDRNDPNELRDYSLQKKKSPWLSVYFGDTDDRGPFFSSPPEGLHTLDLGTEKKFAQWSVIMIHDEGSKFERLLDERIGELNQFLFARQGSKLPLKRRVNGLPSLEKLPGDEYQNIIFILIFAIGETDAILPEAKRRPAIRALLGVLYLRWILHRPLTRDEVDHLRDQIDQFMSLFVESYFVLSPTGTDFPKLHYLVHYPELIVEYGDSRNFSGNSWEFKIQQAVKQPALRTQRHASTFAQDLMKRLRKLIVAKQHFKKIHKLWHNFFPVKITPTTPPATLMSVGGHKYNISKRHSEQLFTVIVQSFVGETRRFGDFMETANQAGVLSCHERLTIPEQDNSEKIVLHCQPEGTQDRRTDWVMINWGSSGIHPARLEAIFCVQNGDVEGIFIAIRSLDIIASLPATTKTIPFERRKLSEETLVVESSCISAEAVVIGDLDADGCFWVVPEFSEWPDVLS